MANTGIFSKALGINPYVELLIRRLYWKNVKLLRNRRKTKTTLENNTHVNFSEIITYLKDSGIKEGSVLVAHSSYKELERTGKSPQEIITELKLLIGENGTLAMPAIRRYKEEPSVENYITSDMSNVVCTYDLQRTKIWTGVLPYTMTKMPGAAISRFPLNSMVALGPQADAMMENNLSGDLPTPCGENSSWKFCLDQNAFIVGLGIDLTHSLTMIHVAEDIMNENWPVKDWYRERKFRIIDKDFETVKSVRERKPVWGTLHFAERTLCKDLLNSGIMTTRNIGGILVEIVKAKDLIDFLNSRNSKGYPYFGIKKYLKNA